MVGGRKSRGTQLSAARLHFTRYRERERKGGKKSERERKGDQGEAAEVKMK